MLNQCGPERSRRDHVRTDAIGSQFCGETFDHRRKRPFCCTVMLKARSAGEYGEASAHYYRTTPISSDRSVTHVPGNLTQGVEGAVQIGCKQAVVNVTSHLHKGW